jgi:hypothetical protein
MTTRRVVVLAAVILCLAGFGFAQDEELPIRNWSAPPFWNPAVHPRAEAELPGGMLARVEGMQADSESLPSSPLPFVAITPCRIVDTRVAIFDGFHQPNFIDDESRTFPFPSSPDCPGLPATAGAWSVNIQFRPMSQLSYLTAYPTGTTMPTVSTLTAGPAAWVQNSAIVPAGTSGSIDIYCQYAGRVVIDVNGYYSAAGARFGINRADRLSWLTVKGGEPATLSGTVTVFNGETGVIGVGTAFLSQVGIGDRIMVNSETRTVLAIADDTHLTVDTVWTSNSTGTTIADAGSLIRLDDSSDVARVVVSDEGHMGLDVLDPQQTLSVGGTLGVASTGGTTVLQASPSQAGTITYTLPQAGTNGLLRNTSGALSWDPTSLLSGSGSAGRVAFWSGASSLSGSNNLYWDNTHGRLGLGTTTPGQQLELTGMMRMPRTAATSGTPTTGVLFLGTDPFLHNYGPTSDAGNTFVGQQAGNFTMGGGTTVGVRNTATGYQSLHSDTTGYYNTASGYQSLYSNTTGHYNTASGYRSLSENTTGGANTAVGNESLEFNTTASYNTATGFFTLYSNINGGGNSAIGAWALGANTSGLYNTAIGYASLGSNTEGQGNTACGQASGSDNVYGLGNTFIGAFTSAAANNLINATAIGNAAEVDASNHVRIGNTQVTQIGGQVAWSNLSDARAKTSIRDLDLGLDFVMDLRPVAFSLKSGDGRTDMGFLAQDVEALLGDGYSLLGIGGDADRTLSLRYTDLIAPLVKAIQEQQQQLASQQAQLEAKDVRIAALEHAVDTLQAMNEAQQARMDAQQAQFDEVRRQVQMLLAQKAPAQSAEAVGN